MSTARERERRVLVFAPGYRNAEVITRRLRGARFSCIVRDDVRTFDTCLRDEWEKLGAVMVTATALRHGAAAAIVRFQEQEPEWSALPIVLLSPPSDAVIAPWRNTTVLVQPTTGRNLVAMLERAVEARDQQRQLARVNQRLERIAYQDVLTGLPNRLAIYERIRELQSERRGSRGTFATIFLDLDGFKRINDTYGHAAGDEALRQVAAHLSASVRESDFVARWGGDEFIVLLIGTDGSARLPTTVDRLVEGLVVRLEDVHEPIVMTLSVGHLGEIGPEQSVDQILSLADDRMYQQKHGKRRKEEHAELG